MTSTNATNADWIENLRQRVPVEPYYAEDGIVIWCSDCREVLPFVGRFDLCLTDPPYGIGQDYRTGGVKHGWTAYGNPDSRWDLARPPTSIFTHIRAISKDAIIWGGNYFADILPARQCWLVWDKGQENFSLADVELAWTSYDNAARRKLIHRSKALSDGKRHPTQKPVDLMTWCVEAVARRYGGDVSSIIDPFLGSGTTLVAAKRLGIRAVGIEREERYCEIAVERIKTTTPSLFDERKEL